MEDGLPKETGDVTNPVHVGPVSKTPQYRDLVGS